MLTQEKHDELAAILNDEKQNISANTAASLQLKIFKVSEIDIDVYDILEGFDPEITSDNKTKKLYDIKPLEQTLNPDFDGDYEDPYAEVWENFINSLANADYFIIIE